MANDTNYWGLRPVKHISGAPWNGVTEMCYVGADYGVALYIGDPVQIGTDITESDATGKYTSIELAGHATTSPIYGVITSFVDHEDRANKKVWKPASTESYVNVCVDPTVVYLIRGDGSGTPIRDWVFSNAVMVAGTSSTVTGYSGYGLDESTPAQTLADPLLILRVANLPDNTLGDNCVWEVLINTHQLRAAATGNVTGINKT